MSTIAEKVAPILTPTPQSAPGRRQREDKRKRGRRYKARMATKVRQALEDAMKRSIAARRRMRSALQVLEEIRTMFESHDRLSGKDYELLVRVYAQIGKLEHELLGWSVEVADTEEIVARAIAESKPEKCAQ